jgi:F420-non-reducing hydrogenase iron-sulfur subunit
MSFILRAFSNGTDGVFVGGCHLNDCHYNTEGNYDALSVMHLCKKLMKHIGLHPDRLRLEWVSAGEGTRFAEVMNDFSQKIKALGPLGTSEGIDEKELKFRLEACTKLVPYIKLVERERIRVRFSTEKEYEEFFASEEVNRLFDETIAVKLTIAQIVLLLRDACLSSVEIARRLGLNTTQVARHLNALVKQQLVKYDEAVKRYALAYDKKAYTS